MRKVHPPQLIEALIIQQELLQDLEDINLTVKRFNELVRRMATIEYQLDFSYRELLDFASQFHKDIFIIDEVEIHLHFSEDLKKRLAWYNKMYSDIQEPLKRCDLWKMLGK